MRKWFNSVRLAIQGIIFLFTFERNAKIEATIALIALILSLWLKISWFEFCLIFLCIGGVLSAEAFNSAIEKLADLHTKEPHPDIKILKDMSAGAVLIISIMSLAVGMLVFAPKLFEKFWG